MNEKLLDALLNAIILAPFWLPIIVIGFVKIGDRIKGDK